VPEQLDFKDPVQRLSAQRQFMSNKAIGMFSANQVHGYVVIYSLCSSRPSWVQGATVGSRETLGHEYLLGHGKFFQRPGNIPDPKPV
jgi:hypothetical protein